MSLIILSNDYDTENNKIDKAYNWRNYMTNTINIKKNSEVAVVSAKIVKNNQIIIPKDFQFYCYWGPGYDTDTFANEKSVRALIRTDQDLNADNVNYNTLADSLTSALKYGFVYPNLHELSKVSVAYNVSKLFTGYTYDIIDKETTTNQVSELSNDDFEHLYSDIYTSNNITYGNIEFDNDTDRIIAKENSIYNVIQYDRKPMSLKSNNTSGGGEVWFNIENITNNGIIGLKTPDQRGGLKVPYAASHYTGQFTNILLPPTPTIFMMLRLNNFDFAVYIEVVNANKMLSMVTLIDGVYYPVDYFTQNDAIGNTQVIITDQKQIKFICQGEEVRVAITNNDGTIDTMLVDETINNENQYNFKGIGMVTSCLVPFIALERNNDYVTIDKINGATIQYNNNKNGFQAGPEQQTEGLFADPFGCWSTRAISNNNSQNFSALELQYGFHIRTNTYTRNLNFYGSYSPAFIFSSSDSSLHSARGMSTLGFEDPVVKDWTQSLTNKWSIASSVKPETGNKNSLFIRMDNLTTRSYNAGLHSESKIIYALPRFGNDSNGQDVGALFFEPGEKTYIELGNTNEINLSSLDISIVNENETLAYDLTGKSVIVIHIRQVK